MIRNQQNITELQTFHIHTITAHPLSKRSDNVV